MNKYKYPWYSGLGGNSVLELELWLNSNFSIGIGEIGNLWNWNWNSWNENHVNGIEILSCGQAALWMLQSVRPSVRHTFFTMFPSSYHHKILGSYNQGVGHSFSQPPVHPCFARAIELIAHPKIAQILSFSWGFSSKVVFCTPWNFICTPWGAISG